MHSVLGLLNPGLGASASWFRGQVYPACFPVSGVPNSVSGTIMFILHFQLYIFFLCGRLDQFSDMCAF